MLYDYRCCKCGTEFDDFRPVRERRYSTCPKCGARAPLLFRPTAANNSMKQFEPYVDHHLSPDGNPVRVESREQKRRLMRQQNLEWVGSARWV